MTQTATTITVSWIRLNPEDPGVLTRAPEAIAVPVESTVVQGLLEIGMTQSSVNKMLKARTVSIFGVYATESTLLHEGDRIEILDNLRTDPMESRTRRVAHKRKMGLAQFGKVERRSQKRSKN